jgi:hypothetical protein
VVKSAGTSSMPTQCQGSTHLRYRCKRMTTESFCSCHSHQHNFYFPKGPDWPDVHSIRKRVKTFHNKWLLIEHCFGMISEFANGTTCDVRLGCLAMVENMIKNPELLYGDPIFEKIKVNFFCVLAEFPPYLAHFRKTCDIEYRIWHQKQYIATVLNKTILDHDSIRKVISYL